MNTNKLKDILNIKSLDDLNKGENINMHKILEEHLAKFIISTKFYNELLEFCQYINNYGKIRLVGGCVRDFLLNKVPTDIDLSSNLEPHIIMQLAKKYGAKTIPTGIDHGTVTVVLNSLSIEITTLRYDVKCDGRRAIIQFTNDFREDAKRRDFTINAMSFCLLENKLFDYFDGIMHLYKSKVIFIGDAKQRICEDYLRILRFFRFTSYYAKEIDMHGYEFCLEFSNNLKQISQERITSELNKIFNNTKNLSYILKYLQNIFHYIGLPQLSIKDELLSKIEYYAKIYQTTVKKLQLELNLNEKILNNINIYNLTYPILFKEVDFCKQMKFSNIAYEVLQLNKQMLEVFNIKDSFDMHYLYNVNNAAMFCNRTIAHDDMNSKNILYRATTVLDDAHDNKQVMHLCKENCKNISEDINLEFEIIKNLYKLHNIIHTHINIKTIIKILIYKYILNKNKNIEIIINLIAICYSLGLYQEKINFNVKLPITGIDIMQIISHSNQIKNIINFSQEIYIISNFELTKEEILKNIKLKFI